MIIEPGTKEIFLSIEQCINNILLNVAQDNVTKVISDVWNWDLLCSVTHPRDIQHISQARTAQCEPDVRRFVLGMHLQAVSDAIGKKQQQSAYDHLKEIFLRYEKYSHIAGRCDSKVTAKNVKSIDDSTARLLHTHRNFIRAHAHIFLKKRPFMTLDEVWQNMRIGMMKAIRTYNSNMPFQFTTHAYWYMMQTQNRAFEEELTPMFGLSTEEYYKVFKLQKIIETHHMETGEYPSYELIAEKLKCTVKKVKTLSSCPTKRIPYGYVDQICEKDKLEIAIFENQESKHLNELVNALKWPMNEIIKHSFGLGDCDTDQIKDISEKLGIKEFTLKYYKKKALGILAVKMKEKMEIS